MSDYTPVNSDNTAFTATVGGTQGGTAIHGGDLLMMETGNTGNVVLCDATHRPVGVAASDTPLGVSARVTVYILPGMVHELPITGTTVVSAGDDIVPAAAGQVSKNVLATDAASGLLIGMCIRGGTGGQAGSAGKARFIGV